MSTRRSRVKKGSADQKSALLQLRLSEAEKEAFEEAANLSGLALSAWVRERPRRTAMKELEEWGKPVAFLRPAQEG